MLSLGHLSEELVGEKMTRKPTGYASRWLKNGVTVLALTIFVIGWGTQGAMATSSPSVEQLQKAIAALEARVAALAPLEARIAALEERLQRSETVSGQQTQEASMPRPLLVSLADGTVQPSPMMVAPGAQPVPLPEENGWSGFYWGTSFGYGSGNAKSKYSNVRSGRYEQTSVGSDRQVNGDGEVFTNLGSQTYINEYTDKYSAQSKGSLRNEGALADLYLGASAHLTPRILAGVQVEGTLSAMPFDSKISGSKGTFKNSYTNINTHTQGDGDAYQYVNSNKETGKFTNEYNETVNLELDWMVSVIGRAGWLATPTTLLYGLGGWSYGHFDVEDVPWDFGLGSLQDFNANGPTVGGGIEQKLSPKWSLRAEYRYTNFGKHSFSTKSQTTDKDSGSGTSSGSDKETCCDGERYSSSSSGTDSSTSTGVNNDSSRGYFDNDMHVGRVGVTRYFTLGD